MKKKVFQTQYNRVRNADDKVTCTDSHLTVPQESMTLKEIFKRHMKGMLPMPEVSNIDVEDVDFDSPDYEKFNRMDMAEKEMLVEIESRAVVNANRILEAKNKKKKEEENQRLIDEKVKEEIEKLQNKED